MANNLAEASQPKSFGAATDDHAVSTLGLASAVRLHLLGRREEALEELKGASNGESLPEVHFAQGRLSYDLGRYEEAAQAFTRFLEAWPDHKTGNFNLALCLQNLARWRDAEARFRKVLELVPIHRQARHGLAVSLLYEQKLEESLEIFERLSSEQPNEEALFGKAVCLQLLGEAEEARKTYENVLAMNPSAREALVNLIVLHRQQKNIQDLRRCSAELLKLDASAEAAYEGLATAAFWDEDYTACASHCMDLLHLTPESFDTWLNLGLAWHKAKEPAKAIEAYERASALRPDHVEPYTSLGVIHQEQGQLAEARRDFEHAVSVSPRSADQLLNLGYNLELQHLWEEAEGVFDQLTKAHPTNPEGWFRQGFVHLQLENFQAAAADFAACLRLRQDWWEAQVNLGLTHYKHGDLASARSVLTNLLGKRPSCGDALRAMAAIALDEGKDEEALEIHKRLIELKEHTPEVLYNAALLSQKLHRLEDAENLYRQALSDRPTFAEALLNLGHTLAALGKTDEATESWVKAIEAKPELAKGYFLPEATEVG